ncbi:MAG: flagellar filament capping protein FliD [Steroidobacteraceae bacterium]
MATTTTTSTSSATSGVLSTLGIGSGIDISSLVSQLVAAERAPAETRLTSQASDIATKISAMAQLKGALSTFQTALANLKSGSALTAITATSADDSVFTATATSSAAEGSYDVEVSQLAKAQQLVSAQTFSGGGDTVVGYGTLTLKLGSNAFSVTLDSSHNTLSDIRDSINNASGNTGIKASLINGTSGTQLVLTSTKTGASNSITVSTSGGDGGLAALAYAPDTTSSDGTTTTSTTSSNYTVKQAAQDADLTIAGIAYSGSSNTISDALEGVTLTLTGTTDTDSPVTLTVGNDSSTVLTNIQAFVTAYNTMIGVFNTLGNYDSETQTGGPLLGDGLLTNISTTLTRLTTDRVSGLSSNYSSLATLGITTQSDGTLTLDTAKYKAALANDPQALQDIFASENGVATRLDKQLTDLMATGGSIDARNTNLIDSQTAITTQTKELDARMDQVEARLTAQFTAMDTLMAQLNTTASYLDKAFATKSSSSSSS